MPCEYLIDPERRLVVSRGTGTFRHRDYLEHVEKMSADPRFQPGFNHLVDCRHFEHLDLTADELQSLGKLTLFAASSRRALVVASLLHFGLARMFAAFRSRSHRQETAVFRSMEDAIAWLGLPAAYEPGRLVEATPTTKQA
jgi:hypothetical protein